MGFRQVSVLTMPTQVLVTQGLESSFLYTSSFPLVSPTTSSFNYSEKRERESTFTSLYHYYSYTGLCFAMIYLNILHTELLFWDFVVCLKVLFFILNQGR